MSRKGPLATTSTAARLVAAAVLAFVGLASPPVSGRAGPSPYEALPRADERLEQPIWLPHCQMRIVEWRSTTMLHDETTPSDAALAVMDDACRAAFDRYPAFLRSRGLPRLREQPDALPAISLLPGNTLIDGKTPRALNDMPTRFKTVAPACCYWGLYVDSIHHLFLRNNPLGRDADGALVANRRFVRTLTHEMSHILSSRLGVWDLVGYDRDQDEEIAEAFVGYMGFAFRPESSAEDLALHRAHATRRSSPSASNAVAPSLTGALTSETTAGGGGGAPFGAALLTRRVEWE